MPNPKCQIRNADARFRYEMPNPKRYCWICLPSLHGVWIDSNPESNVRDSYSYIEFISFHLFTPPLSFIVILFHAYFYFTLILFYLYFYFTFIFFYFYVYFYFYLHSFIYFLYFILIYFYFILFLFLFYCRLVHLAIILGRAGQFPNFCP